MTTTHRREIEPSDGHGPNDRWVFTGPTPFSINGIYKGERDLLGAEMLHEADLDWTVSAQPVYYQTGPKAEGGRLLMSQNYKAIIRDRDSRELGHVRNGYHHLQNAEAAKVMDSAVADGKMRFVAAGDFDDGSRIWLLGHTGTDTIKTDAQGPDKVGRFLLLHTGHDGGTSTRIVFAQGRPRCNNFIRAALSAGAGDGITVRHTKNQHAALAQAARVLGMAREAGDKAVEFMKRCALTTLTEERWVKMAGALVPDPEEGSNARAASKREDMTRLLFRGRGQIDDGSPRTLWDAHNAVSEYLSYHRQSRGDEFTAQQNRWKGVMFGGGAQFMARANELLLEMLGSPADLEPSAPPVDAQALMSEIEA